jgi:hypothetical protein
MRSSLGNRRIAVKSACVATAAVVEWRRPEFREAGMIVEFAALAVLVVAIAFAIGAMRRALAAALVGEISETLNLLETHDVENGLAHIGDDGRPAPNLPTLPTVSYRSDAAFVALLGPHLARLSASFYGSAEALQDELRALEKESAGPARDERVRCAVRELQRTAELGEEALRSLRDIVSHRRHDIISRA